MSTTGDEGAAAASGTGAGTGTVVTLPLPPITSPWDGEINLREKQGKALWDEGIKPLENKFNGLGKDVVRFIADVKNRSDKCKWKAILTFSGKFLLTHYGEISTDEIRQARDDRDLTTITTINDARPKINN